MTTKNYNKPPNTKLLSLLFLTLGWIPLFAQSFVTTWKTDNPGTSNSSSITIPTVGGGYNYDVDWNNDGIFDDFGVTGNITHDYGVPGTYTIAIKGDFPRIYFNGNGDNLKLLSIDQWGEIEWSNMYRAFSGASNMTYNATDVPDLSYVTTTAQMFFNASAFNGDIGNWDVSNITNMSYMFYGNSNFNQDLNSWDVSNVTNMSFMFYGNSNFNQDLNNWDVSNVTSMYHMFYNASAFNGDISNWDVSNVIAMAYMFEGALNLNQDLNNWDVSNVINMYHMFYLASSFNGDVNNWDVSNVINMSGMFYKAILFDRDISTWDVSSVTNMAAMFHLASSFNTDIGSWDVSNATNMSYMFDGASSFNQDLNNWDVSNVTNMAYMFWFANSFNGDISTWDVSSVESINSMFGGASAFNGDLSAWDVSNIKIMFRVFYVATLFNSDLSNWDVSNVINMSQMFYSTSSFNADISAWDISNVTNISQMFRYAYAFNRDLSLWDVSNVTSMAATFYLATSFDQDLGMWDISSVTNMADMLFLSALSVTNYDNTLIGWAQQDVQNDVPLGARGLEYCLGEAARTILINNFDWIIIEDDLADIDLDGDGYSSCQGDCDDENPDINPGVVEICDGIDNDCNNIVDEGLDSDSDGIADCYDNCIMVANPYQEDEDCDGVGDSCDLWPGCDDTIDSDNDGIPNCIDEDEISNWPCGNNGSKVIICHVPPSNPSNRHDICISPNALLNHLDNHGDYIGTCDQIFCGNIENRIVHSSEISNTIDISPNPIGERLKATYHVDQVSTVTVRIIDLSGKILIARQENAEIGLNEISLDVSEIANGVYVLIIETTGNNYSEKFIKMNNF